MHSETSTQDHSAAQAILPAALQAPDCAIQETALGSQLEKLWALMPEKIELVVSLIETEATKNSILDANSPVIAALQRVGRRLGKQVSLIAPPALAQEKSLDWFAATAANEHIEICHSTRKGTSQSLFQVNRFDPDVVRLVAGAFGLDWEDPAKRGLVGSNSSGLIRNTYFLARKDVTPALDPLDYLRSCAGALGSSSGALRFQLDELREDSKEGWGALYGKVMERLSQVMQFDEIVLVLGHFNDHTRSYKPSDMKALFALHFPGVKVTEIDGSGGSYEKYWDSDPDLDEIAARYTEPASKTLFVYDRHAWGVFNKCRVADLKHGAWYYDPRSTGEKILLQLPTGNLIGDLRSKNNTPEAKAIFEEAGLTRPFDEEDLDRLAERILLSLAQQWHMERSDA